MKPDYPRLNYCAVGRLVIAKTDLVALRMLMRHLRKIEHIHQIFLRDIFCHIITQIQIITHLYDNQLIPVTIHSIILYKLYGN